MLFSWCLRLLECLFWLGYRLRRIHDRCRRLGRIHDRRCRDRLRRVHDWYVCRVGSRSALRFSPLRAPLRAPSVSINVRPRLGRRRPCDGEHRRNPYPSCPSHKPSSHTHGGRALRRLCQSCTVALSGPNCERLAGFRPGVHMWVRQRRFTELRSTKTELRSTRDRGSITRERCSRRPRRSAGSPSAIRPGRPGGRRSGASRRPGRSPERRR